MSLDLDRFNADFEGAIEFLRHDISGLRTGRATPALVEDIVIEAYGTKQPLKAVASISVADAKTLNVDPWDKSLIPEVEKAIRQAPTGLSPVNDGKLIRLILPDLSTDRRQELVKLLHQKLEHSRISIRKIREDVRDAVEKAFKDKEISEDEKYKFLDDLEKVVKSQNELIKKIGEEKETEILKV